MTVLGWPSCWCWRRDAGRDRAEYRGRNGRDRTARRGGDKLRALEVLQADRRAMLRANEAARARFAADATAPSASLDALRDAATRAGIPVLLYWTTFGNVIAWYVGPDGSDVRQRVPAGKRARREDRPRAREQWRQPGQTAVRRDGGARAVPVPARTVRDAAEPGLRQADHDRATRPAGAAAVRGADRSCVGRPCDRSLGHLYAPNATMAVAALQRSRARSEPSPRWSTRLSTTTRRRPQRSRRPAHSSRP